MSLLLFASCKSLWDNGPEGKYENECWIYVKEKNIITFINRNNVGAGGDGIYYKPQNFKISLPRKITSFSSVNSGNFINYGHKKIIMVDSDYKKKDFKRGQWENIIDEDKVVDYIKDFYTIRNKKFNYDREISQLKSYDLYFDGQTYILFYNVENITKFDKEQILKSFKYIE